MKVTHLIETAYDLDGDEVDWLRKVARASDPWLPRGLSVVAYVADLSPGWQLSVRSVGSYGDESHEALAHQVAPQFPPDQVRRFYGLGFGSVASLGVEVPPASLAIGVGDFVCAMTADGDGSSVLVGRTSRSVIRTTEGERHLWRRIGTHLAAGARLRRSIARVGHETEEARFSPRGTCVDARAGGRGTTARETLRAAVASRERARTRTNGLDTHERLDLWQGLVAGRWSLLDTYENDGKRFVVAHRNTTPHATLLALTPREREVVQLVVLGRTTKDVAYSLGVAPSTVSHALTAALRKLRMRSLAELAESYGHLRATRAVPLGDDLVMSTVTPDPSAPPESLTCAEAAVYALVATGASNAAVARARNTSERTVANQIATILKKLDLASRRAIITARGGRG